MLNTGEIGGVGGPRFSARTDGTRGSFSSTKEEELKTHCVALERGNDQRRESVRPSGRGINCGRGEEGGGGGCFCAEHATHEWVESWAAKGERRRREV